MGHLEKYHLGEIAKKDWVRAQSQSRRIQLLRVTHWGSSTSWTFFPEKNTFGCCVDVLKLQINLFDEDLILFLAGLLCAMIEKHQTKVIWALPFLVFTCFCFSRTIANDDFCVGHREWVVRILNRDKSESWSTALGLFTADTDKGNWEKVLNWSGIVGIITKVISGKNFELIRWARPEHCLTLVSMLDLRFEESFTNRVNVQV